MGRVVTIDGPAGVGKSTAAKALARRLGWLYLDSGSLYRAVAWIALGRGLDPGTAEGRRAAVEELAGAVRFVRDASGETRLMVGTREPGEELRTDAVARSASQVATDSRVRGGLLPVQRGVAEDGDVVAEGRDMGTVVFPQAEMKFFLTAPARVRARRRLLEFESGGRAVDPQEVMDEMMQRDDRDVTREVSPLVPAADAVLVETGSLDAEEVVEELATHVHRRFPELDR